MTAYGLGRPGVFLQENLVQQNIVVPPSSNAVAAFIGYLPKGPETPTYVTSWADFNTYFGGIDYNIPTTLAAYMFFANNGRNAYIRRVTKNANTALTSPSIAIAGSAGAVKTATITATHAFSVGQTVTLSGWTGNTAVNGTWVVDSISTTVSFTIKLPTTAATTTPTGGSVIRSLKAGIQLNSAASTPTFNLIADNSGSWGNNIAVDIVGTASRFSFTVYGAPLGSTTPSRSNVLEQFTDLNMTTADANYFASIVNQLSNYVTVTDLKTGAVALNSDTLTALSSGADGSSTLTTTELGATTWADFDAINGPLIFNLPDVSVTSTTWTTTNSATAVNSLISYAETRGDAFVIVDPHNDATVSTAVTYAGSVLTTGSLSGKQSAMYFPWLTIPDTSKSVRGITTSVAPGGAIAGIYQKNDTSRGVFTAPAGYSTRLSNVLGLATSLTNQNLDDLNQATNAINAIKVTPGNGIVVMGGRTLSINKSDRYISVRRSLIYLKRELTDRSAFAVFENNDPYLWNRIQSSLSSFLNSYWQQGGLRGSTTDQAFFVKCDSSTTTETDTANGRVNIQIGVALEYPAEFVLITIGQITGNASV